MIFMLITGIAKEYILVTISAYDTNGEGRFQS